MAHTVSTSLMFDGSAEEAMNQYVSLFKGSKITRLEHYGANEDGTDGSVKQAEFELSGHKLICFDSPIKHNFTFTPSISLFVSCEDEAELDRAFKQLSAHQFYNHTDETVDILTIGENLPYEVCYYPDSNKWLSRSIGKIGKFEETDYWTDEPNPPTLKSEA